MRDGAIHVPAVCAGIGLFITLLGAKSCGLIIANEAKKSLGFGDLKSPEVIVAVIGFIILLILKSRKIQGDMILAIAATTIVGIPFGVTKMPESLLTMRQVSADSL